MYSSDSVIHTRVSVLSRVRLFCDPKTAAHQAPLSMELFSDKNTGVGCHFLLQGIFPTQGSKQSLVSPALAGGFLTTAPPGKPIRVSILLQILFPCRVLHNIEHSFLCHTVETFHMVLRHDSDIKGIHLC